MKHGAHPNQKMTRPCVDCPATIPALGNRKRCVDCQDRAYKTRNSRKSRRVVVNADDTDALEAVTR